MDTEEGVGAVVTDSGVQLLPLHPLWHLSPGEAERKSRLLWRPAGPVGHSDPLYVSPLAVSAVFGLAKRLFK